MKNILIIGSLGQLGSEIALECRRRYGDEHVVLTDIRDDEIGRASCRERVLVVV